MKLEELIDRVTEDKKRLSHRVNKCMTNGEDTNLTVLYLHWCQ